MNSKLLTVIIPAYNASKYIEECLGSLKHFMGDELEIIVINDGSSDNTATLVNSCIAKDSRIKLVSLPNSGVSQARNIGIENAVGKYIMFLDADDYLLDKTFEEVNAIIQEDHYDFVAFARDILEEDGKKWTQCFPFSDSKTDEKAVSDRIMYTTSLFNECWGKLFRRDLVVSNNLRFPVGVPIGEDYMFVVSYYAISKKPLVINSSLVAYRQHGNSAMRKYTISDRLAFTQNLFECTYNSIPLELKKETDKYYFKVLTNLCREYSDRGYEDIKIIYNSVFCHNVINNLNIRDIPLYKKHEYLLIIFKMYRLSAFYYSLKKSL